MASAGTGRGKSKVMAGVLGILLGLIGAHHFYLGSTGTGIILLVLTCCTGLGGIIGLVEGIMLLVMKDEDFDAKYNNRSPENIEFVFQKKH